MPSDNLWAPWRKLYITAEKPADCVFCHAQKSDDDAKNYVLYRDDLVFVIMNLYPYNNGHIMIIPNRHISDYTELTAAERNRLAELTNISLQVLKKALNPQGFNIGYNLGAAAGAGIASHMHQHIVPRWSGDTNFMPVVADIKVISEHMDETYRKLLKVFKELPLPSRGWHDLL